MQHIHDTAIFVGDIQGKLGKQSGIDLKAHLHRLFDDLFNAAREANAKYIIHAGDLFEFATDIHYLDFMTQIFNQYQLSHPDIVFCTVTGNHDQIEEFYTLSRHSIEAAYPVTALNILSDSHDNFQIIDYLPFHRNFLRLNDEYVVVGIPHFDQEVEFFKTLDLVLAAADKEVSTDTKIILVGHQNVSPIMTSEISATDPRFNRFFSVKWGHVHKRDTLTAKMHYIGSPEQLKAGGGDTHLSPKGYEVFYFNTGDFDFVERPTARQMPLYYGEDIPARYKGKHFILRKPKPPAEVESLAVVDDTTVDGQTQLVKEMTAKLITKGFDENLAEAILPYLQDVEEQVGHIPTIRLKSVTVEGMRTVIKPITIDFKHLLTYYRGPVGSGKTTLIIYALYWILTGKWIVPGKLEDHLVTKKELLAKLGIKFKGTRGELVLEVDGMDYTIIRCRNYKEEVGLGEYKYKGGNNLFIFKSDQPLALDIDAKVDRGNAKKTAKLLELLRLTESNIKYILLLQQRINLLDLSAKPADFQQLLVSLFDIEWVNDVQHRMKKDLDRLAVTYQQNKGKFNSLVKAKQDLNARIVTLSSQVEQVAYDYAQGNLIAQQQLPAIKEKLTALEFEAEKIEADMFATAELIKKLPTVETIAVESRNLDQHKLKINQANELLQYINQYNTLYEKQGANEEKLAKLENDLTALVDGAFETYTAPVEGVVDTTELQQKIEAAGKALAKTHKRILEIEANKRTLTSHLENLNKAVKEAEQDVAEMLTGDKCLVCGGDLDGVCEAENSPLHKVVANQQERVATTKDKLQALDIELQQLVERRHTQDNELSTLDAKLVAITEENTKLSKAHQEVIEAKRNEVSEAEKGVADYAKEVAEEQHQLEKLNLLVKSHPAYMFEGDGPNIANYVIELEDKLEEMQLQYDKLAERGKEAETLRAKEKELVDKLATIDKEGGELYDKQEAIENPKPVTEHLEWVKANAAKEEAEASLQQQTKEGDKLFHKLESQQQEYELLEAAYKKYCGARGLETLALNQKILRFNILSNEFAGRSNVQVKLELSEKNTFEVKVKIGDMDLSGAASSSGQQLWVNMLLIFTFHRLLAERGSNFLWIGLDEPFKNLSPKETIIVKDAIDTMTEKGVHVNIITHSETLDVTRAKVVRLKWEENNMTRLASREDLLLQTTKSA